ncbi:MAG: STAS domain-containing protein [Magnetococcales bacterium]|nr:STAS domain-containing protein [Magnetococcales bacterium]
MAIDFERAGDTITIRIQGEFGHEYRNDFQKIFTSQEGDPHGHHYRIDFKEIKYISSAGAGLLIRLRDYCGGEKANISLINVNDRTLKLLRILNFDKIFQITQ